MLPAICCFIIIFLFFYIHNNYYKDIDIVKGLNNVDYIVRDLPDKKLAANTLSKISNKLSQLIDFVKDPLIKKRLKNRYKANKLSEGTVDYKYTTYTLNKGEKMVFCLRDRKSEKLHRLNILMFVAIHELAHVASISEGHTEEFKKNFQLLLKTAIENGLYTNEKFSENPQTYCGTVINSNGGV